MIIVGAKGFAREVLETIDTSVKAIAFFDDISTNLPERIFNKYPILRTEEEVRTFFANNGTDFTLGLGKPGLRKKLAIQFENWGGTLVSTISKQAVIGREKVSVGAGCNILANATFSNDTQIGMGSIAYYGAVVTHDCTLGNFVELSPGATLLGRSSVGDFTHIGANATILPDITIGKNCIVAAGAVVTKDVPDNCMVAGVPAKIKKHL